MKFLLDTSVVVDYFRGADTVKQLLPDLLKKGELSISLITYGELLYGTHRSDNHEGERQKVQAFINDFKIDIVPLAQESIEIYARTKYLLGSKGKKIDELDLLIGATAVERGFVFITGNIKHFINFPGLNLYSQ